ILNKTILQRVREDIARTSMPTAVGRAPVDLGNAGAGTLTADQWRTVCTIHLPITLIRLWANLPPDDRRRKLLDNFIHMVIAVRYGTARRVSRARINMYTYHIFRYVQGLRELFPEQDLVPNQHLALHLGEILARFGPTQAYWAFPFERYIRLLRQANINHRNNEVESTFFNAWCMTNNLKGLLSSTMLPQTRALEELASLIDTTFIGEDATTVPSRFGLGSEPGLECNEQKTSLLPIAVYRALLARISDDPTINHSSLYCSVYDRSPATQEIVLNASAQSMHHVHHRGKRFCTYSHCEADSNIVYRDVTDKLALGRIEGIFVHKRRCQDGEFHHQAFVTLHKYQGLTGYDMEHDPYRRFKGLRATLIYDSLSCHVEVVPMKDVVSHFAKCPYDDGAYKFSKTCLVALPLDQVSAKPSLTVRNLPWSRIETNGQRISSPHRGSVHESLCIRD
ncbi:hypothetical protein C8Q76DRAFT_616501, partial [Earliella scabrosa]